MTDLTSVQKKYKGKWVAFTDDLKSVISASKDVKTAYNEALKKGYNKPTLFKVPLHIVPYVGFIKHVAKNI
ncbi:MAG: hypothetical protein COU81_01970 [Candidatus Portnoybacteria bacterium CG10_big_fil_rev_8_21_14_0_10_36_7]|uniref:DUF5678 domain-containing protein n=1 Tax=Candidatus Portnoybacteria bacterium CG10_big_fil_rev_8_21_14_0_10_36_7 TaxID=1974812 RepID=A0A2M8KE62_9BACT|nr:MAG: hypothetical protein COU81_01970 [Candidatus Portnoybacteria bacterium CG10_big_fil_rev_8_21_14_0_10_36_7]